MKMRIKVHKGRKIYSRKENLESINVKSSKFNVIIFVANQYFFLIKA